jgi:hypothetical protein
MDTAALYAKIIISELGLPYKEKTIKPTDIGGVAGGQKVCFLNKCSILLTFVVFVSQHFI